MPDQPTESTPDALGIVHLAALVHLGDGTIDVTKAGFWIDAYGRKVNITTDLLDALVSNFDSGAAGQDVPIDIDHERTKAAGWLRTLGRSGETLVAVPDWNQLGRELVGDRVYRYISATIDLAKKILISASLVNFPAVKGMRPVALSEENAATTDSNIDLFFNLQEITMSAKTETATTSAADNTATPPANETAQTPAATTAALSTPATPVAPATTQAAAPAVSPDVQTLLTALGAQTTAQLAAFQQTMQDAMRAQSAELDAKRAEIVAAFGAEFREEQELVAFSARVTSAGKFALPITPSTLEATLKGLPKANRAAVRDLLEQIYTNGTVDFGEVGTSAARTGSVQELDKNSAVYLGQYIKDGGTIDEFFEINAAELGDKANYDLTAFTAAK